MQSAAKVVLTSTLFSLHSVEAALFREQGSLHPVHCFLMFTGIPCYNIGPSSPFFFFHLQIARMMSALQQQQPRQPGMKHSPSHPVGPKPHLDSMVPNPLNVGLSDLQTKGQIPGYGSGKCSVKEIWCISCSYHINAVIVLPY